RSEIRAAVVEHRANRGIVLAADDVIVGKDVVLLGALDCAYVGPRLLVGCLQDLDEEVGDDLVAVRGDPDAPAGREQRADHPCAGPRLAAPRRALYREHRLVECEADSSRRVEIRLSRRDERRSGVLAEAWRAAEQQVACRPVRPGSVDALFEDPLADLDERRLVLGGPEPIEGHEPDRMRVLDVPPDVDRSGGRIDGHDFADLPAERRVVGTSPRLAGVINRPTADTEVLFGKPVPPHLPAVRGGADGPVRPWRPDGFGG